MERDFKMDDNFGLDSSSKKSKKKSLPELLDIFFENLVKLLLILGGFALLIYKSIDEWQKELPNKWIVTVTTIFIILFISLFRKKTSLLMKITIILTSILFLTTFSFFKYGSQDQGFTIFALSSGNIIAISVLLFIFIFLIFILTRRSLPLILKLPLGILLLYTAVPIIYNLVMKREFEQLFDVKGILEKIPYYLNPTFILFFGFVPLFFLTFFLETIFKRGNKGEGQKQTFLSLALLVIPLFLISAKLSPLFFSFGKGEKGLWGRYYQDHTFANLVMNRIDPKIEFNWKELPPSPKLGGRNFWVEWIGEIYLPQSGEYLFGLDSDDGSLLYLDGVKYVDNWTPIKGWKSEKIKLKSGFHKIRVHYYQNLGEAYIRLGWKKPYDMNIEVIPNIYLRGNEIQRTPREAAQLGLEWLQSESIKWDRHHNCYGCHTQAQAIMGMSIGKDRGYIIDESIFKELTEKMKQYQNDDGSFGIKGKHNISGTFYATGALTYYSKLVGDNYDDMLERGGEFIKSQFDSAKVVYDYEWIEPPIMQGDILLSTYGVITFKRLYELTRKNIYSEALEERRSFLKSAIPKTTQDKVFKLLGLISIDRDEDREDIKGLLKAIYETQNEDGGFSEREGLESNGYATGEVLYGLREARERIGSKSFREGVKYLMGTQHMEGYWSYVPSKNTDAKRPSKYAPTMWAAIGLLSSFAPLNIEISSPKDQENIQEEALLKVSIENFTESPVTHVDYFLEDRILFRSKNKPYDFRWIIQETPKLIDDSALSSSVVDLGGEYRIGALCTTESQEQASDSITVRIVPKLKIKIVSPSQDEYVSEIVPIHAKVKSSSSKIREVNFYIDQKRIKTLYGEPYQYDFEIKWDTSHEDSGKHLITATVISEGGEEEKDKVEVRVARGKLSVVASSKENLFPSFLELILDGSGSMWGTVLGKEGKRITKIKIAKEVMKELIEDIPQGKYVGLRVYGHRFSKSLRNCKDSELVVPVGPVDKEKLLLEISKIYPQGMTPIAYSLLKASEDFGTQKGVIVLVSDGKESCRGDPCKVVKELLKEQGALVKIHVIGFDIEDLSAQEQLKCIAKATEGYYFEAKDAEGLKKSIQESVKISYDIFTLNDTSHPILSGIVNGDPVIIPRGRYNLIVYSDPVYREEFVIEEDEEKVIKLP